MTRARVDVSTSIIVATSWHEPKRLGTLAARGLDFADAEQVFGGELTEEVDARFDHGEERFVTVGSIGEWMVVVVWTWRGNTRHIISTRKASQRERTKYGKPLGRS